MKLPRAVRRWLVQLDADDPVEATPPTMLVCVDEMELLQHPERRRIVLAESERAQQGLAHVYEHDPLAFCWADDVFTGGQAAHERAKAWVWNELHPERRITVVDLDEVIALSDSALAEAGVVLHGQRRG